VASRFARVGLVSTVAFLALFFALRAALGTYGADALALAVCTLPNTAANARFTFRRPLRRLAFAAGWALAVSLAVTCAALAVVAGLGLGALAQAAALVVASAVAAAARFALLHAWMSRHIPTEEVVT
jgi:putative flippase GtrA